MKISKNKRLKIWIHLEAKWQPSDQHKQELKNREVSIKEWHFWGQWPQQPLPLQPLLSPLSIPLNLLSSPKPKTSHSSTPHPILPQLALASSRISLTRPQLLTWMPPHLFTNPPLRFDFLCNPFLLLLQY